MNDTPADDPTNPPGVSRRRLIGSGAAVVGMAAASLTLPPNVRTALASPRPGNGRLSDIKHVVMLMQENRSFDHYYGTLSGVRGFSDAHAMRLPSHRPVFFQPDPSNPDGFLLPYRLNSKITAAQAIPSMSHEWNVQHQALNGGAMDNWVTPPAGTPGEFVFKTSNTGVSGGGLPVGLGFRVPCIIVSPWTTGGYVFSETSDHTSQLRFLERLTGVKETNISDWRRETVGDLTGAFRFNDATGAPPLPDTTGQYNLAQYAVAQFPLPSIPGAQQTVPRQEPGHRRHVG